MLRRIILISFIFNSITTLTFAQWELINEPSSRFSFEDVFFRYENMGFVVGVDNDSYSPFGYYRGVILKTIDGGQTWDTTYTESAIYSVFFLNSNFGFAGSTGNWFYKTINGGTSWDSIQITPVNDHFLTQFHSVYFTSNQVGFLSNTPDYGNNKKTNDGGITWENIVLPNGNTTLEPIIFINNTKAYLGCNYKSVNGGISWYNFSDSITAPLSINNSYVLTLDNDYFGNTGIVATSGVNYDEPAFPNGILEGAVGITHDGGLTWSHIFLHSLSYLLTVKIVNENTFYAIGRMNYNLHLDINLLSPFLKSVDGGNTWYQQEFINGPSNNSPYITALSIAGNHTIYAVGTTGQIFKTTNDGGPLYPIPDIPINIYELNNSNFSFYPNPATSKLNIQVPNPQSEKLQLKVFNLNGQVLISQQTQITMNYTLDVSQLPQGNYLLKLLGKNEVFVRKFVIIR